MAISHVWSDGMGNPRANAIPLCVFQKLVAQTSSLSAQGFWWLDTLCFPLSPPEAYNRALLRMKQTYRDSHCTLVIDRWLLKANAAGATAGQLALRVLCSPWSRRLWTLQEARLPPCLLFQFADGPLDLSRLCVQLDAEWDLLFN